MLNIYRVRFATVVLTIAAFLPAGSIALAQNSRGGAPNYAGYFDHAGCDSIVGWAADQSRLNSSITVSIYVDGMLAITTPASGSRPDVGSFLGDNGLHGFMVPTPASVKDGQTHQVRVLFESSTIDLNSSPASVICTAGPPPLCADHVITTTPNQGSSISVMNHFCRDKDLRTRYDAGGYVTINDPILQQTVLLDSYTQTYGVFSWKFGGTSTNLGTAVSGDLTTQGAAPPQRPPGGCPTGNDGWSVTTPGRTSNTPPPVPSQAPTQTLNVWTCPSLVLPMYLQMIDPNFGTTELEFQRIVTGDPDPQSFAVPASYTRDDSFSLSQGFGSSCVVRQAVDPVIVVSSGSHLGQTIVTAMTLGSGCPFTDATIYVGRSLDATPLTSSGSPVFQLSLRDNGNSQYPHPVDTAQVFLTTGDGAVSSHLMILLKIN
jgi:hypothetical protein